MHQSKTLLDDDYLYTFLLLPIFLDHLLGNFDAMFLDEAESLFLPFRARPLRSDRSTFFARQSLELLDKTTPKTYDR